MNKEKVLEQNMNDKAPERSMPIAFLLFDEKPHNIDRKRLKKDFESIVGEVGDMAEDENAPCMFPVLKYKAEFSDMEQPISPMACFNEPADYDASKLDEMVLSQLWEVKHGKTTLKGSKYMISVFAMLAAIEYKEQAELFISQIEAVLMQYPECTHLFMPITGKLYPTANFIDDKKYDVSARFIKAFMNVRYFNVQGTDECIIDSLGFFTFGFPDVQLHFKGLNPNWVVNYVYNIAAYQYESEFCINNEETIDGIGADGKISREIQWKCRYEDSLVQPIRVVLDVNCGEFAAGKRG